MENKFKVKAGTIKAAVAACSGVILFASFAERNAPIPFATVGIPSGPITREVDPASAPSAPAARWPAIAKDLQKKGFLSLAFSSYSRSLSSPDLKTSECLSILENLLLIQRERKNLVLPVNASFLTQLSVRLQGNEDGTRLLQKYVFTAFMGNVAAESKGNRNREAALLGLMMKSPLHARTAAGLIEARSLNFKAANAYLSAVLKELNEKGDSPEEIVALKPELKLAFARSLYAMGENQAAINEYESLFRIGAPMQDAIIESAWAQLRDSHYAKAIGLSYELETGKLAKFFVPEASSIRAIALLENCRYAEARRSIERFSTLYSPVVGWLKQSGKIDSLYEAAIARAEKKVGSETIPDQVWAMWSSSDLFASLQNSIRSSFSEERAAREWITSAIKQPNLRVVLERDLHAMAQARSESAQKIENHLMKMNQAMLSRISQESERLRFVRIETNQGAGRDLIYLNAHPEIKKLEKNLKDPKVATRGKGSLHWGKVKLYNPNAETWTDEIGGFEGQALNRCGMTKEIKAASN